jgi:hypothetical protein
MLLSTFNHLLTLKSFNNEWKKLVDNTFEWSTFQLANGTNLWESQSIFIMRCFEENLKFFSKHSQNTNLSNLGDLHIIDLEPLHENLLSL